ncbi:MAG: Rieske (2Fe-2S) protein [Actinobacteria bacterium]|nr:MAG: Rieske (2Fe-2S) protein [Actinomycetota bacterium]
MEAWQYAGPAERVSEPGTFFASEAGHVPVVVTRGRDGKLRALLNVCRHRGHVVAEGCGRRATLQCPYHAWTYELDGSLRRAPRSEREPGFDATGLSLLPLAVAALGPLVFVNPDRDPPPLHLDLDPEGLRFESSEQREHSGDLQPTTFEADATGLTVTRWGRTAVTVDRYRR